MSAWLRCICNKAAKPVQPAVLPLMFFLLCCSLYQRCFAPTPCLAFPSSDPQRTHPLTQAADDRRADLGRQLASIADFADDLTRTQTQYEMLAKQNAEAYHRLKVCRPGWGVGVARVLWLPISPAPV